MRAVRGALGFILIIAIAAMAIYLTRLPIASIVVRSAMAGAGLENPKAQVAALAADGVVLRKVKIGLRGSEAVNLENVSIAFDWRRLLSDRKVTSVRVGPGTLRLVLSPDGIISLPGLTPGGDGAGEGGLPFDQLSLNDITLVIDAPEGSVHGTLNADYNMEAGGRAALTLHADAAGYEAFRIENAALSIKTDLKRNGAITVSGDFKGDVFSQLGPMRGLDLGFDASGASWRNLVEGRRENFSGAAAIELRSARLSPDESPLLSAVNAGGGVFLFGAQVSEIKLDGELRATLNDARLEVTIPEEDALAARTDTGASLVLTPYNGSPLFTATGERKTLAVGYAVYGASLTALGVFEAEQTDDVWSFHMPAKIGDYQSDAISFANSSFVVDGKTTVTGVSADITMLTALQRASIGRLNIYDASFNATLNVAVDDASNSLTITEATGDCIKVEHVRIVIEEQDTDADFAGAKLCALDGPIAVIDWSGELQGAFGGELTATRARYQLGDTRLSGKPPRIDFDAHYFPTMNTTHATGNIHGGSLILNDAMRLSAAAGSFSVSLDADVMSGETSLRQIRISSTDKTLRIAPLIASLEGNLIDRDVTFTYVMATPEGVRLGEGRGAHNVESARGEATFTFDRLEFARGGLQPAKLAPVLRGVIGPTSGVFAGSTRFGWAPEPIGVDSSAAFQFEEITFQGPGITVNQTVGVNGDVRLASLWPVTTDGVQTISIERIDLAALQLENGTVRFEMPGDDTLRVDQATFPWFGGVLGVYGANASMTGGEAVARLEAKDADLALILEFIDVDGLSGEGILSGVLPLVVEDGKARIENGILESQGPGAIRYRGQASEAAAGAGEQAEIAFGILRDLRFNSLEVKINGPLDGTIDFAMLFEGTGDVPVNNQNVRVPVIYRISLEAALLDLLNQVNVSRNVQMQIERALKEAEN